MKKMAFLSSIAIMTCLSAFATNAKSWDLHNLKIINVYHLTNHDLHKIMQGCHPEIAIEFSKQDFLPIGFFLRGNVIK